MNATANMFDTLEAAKKMVKAHADEGVECPCCTQYVRKYKRKLNSMQAYGLITLVREFRKAKAAGESTWIEFKPKHKARDGGGDFAKLRHWGLVEQQTNEDDTKRTSGFWRPTEKGMEFVDKKIKVASHIFIQTGVVKGFSESEIDIEGALNEKFDYKELMEAK